MKNTKKIIIKGQVYTIIFVDDLFEYNGLTDLDGKIIYISKNIERKEDIYETLVHELLHAHFFECGLFEFADNELLVAWLGKHFLSIVEMSLFLLDDFKKEGSKNGRKR